ncbi:putative uncharacterized protein DDB_G0282133 [Musca vetustissima]|uniref:putative uncharacterized protein DDB_G0282133 n=1 Tax=Musca vetustissima TaxID=27455 RepID=UPI002AB6A411|nr:putative uncharacterized protein DDB_G0282133 [Musca vetustissima]
MKSQHSNNSLLVGSAGVLNRDAALRLDFDKSRSFDEDYREAVVSNNNLNAAAMRYLQAAAESSERNHQQRLRRSSPVEGGGGGGGSGGGSRNTRSPQSSGSSCNNLSVPRQTTSPQNYGTRLCDHEMTYDLMRKSLDRSPIMEFRRGDSAGGGGSSGGGDYDMPIMRNRETINSGGNSELNFMNNDGRIYEHVSSNSLKQQRSLRRTHSPNESHYSLERSHDRGSSRDEMTPPDTTADYRNDYNDMYRRTRSTNRGRDTLKSATTNTNTTTHTKPLRLTTSNCSQAEDHCSYSPKCGTCQHLPYDKQHDYLKSLTLKRNNFNRPLSLQNNNNNTNHSHTLPTTTTNGHIRKPTATTTNISTVKVNGVNTTLSMEANNKCHYDNTFLSSCSEDKKSPLTTPTLQCTKTTTPPIPTRSSSNISQWTLLCKNATASSLSAPSNPSQTGVGRENNFVGGTSAHNTVVNVITTTTMNSSQIRPPQPLMSDCLLTAAATPRVIPLAATSLVFLGEMSVTSKLNDDDDVAAAEGDSVDGTFTGDISRKNENVVVTNGICVSDDNEAAAATPLDVNLAR